MLIESLQVFLQDFLLIVSVFTIGAASPGPATIMIMNVSVGEGRKQAVILALGIILGSMFWAFAVGFGFVTLLGESTILFHALKLLGGGYLLLLAYQTIRSGGKVGQQSRARQGCEGDVPLRIQFFRGLLLHLTNPKAPLVWMAIFSIGTAQEMTPTVLLLNIIGCSIASVIVFVGYAVLFSTKTSILVYESLGKPVNFFIGGFYAAAGVKVISLDSV